MVCCIINVLVLSSQQGGSADHSPSRTNTCQRIKKEELSGRSVHQCVRWCQAWGELRGRSGRNRKLTSVNQSRSPRLLSQGSALRHNNWYTVSVTCQVQLDPTAASGLKQKQYQETMWRFLGHANHIWLMVQQSSTCSRLKHWVVDELSLKSTQTGPSEETS